MKKTRYEVEKYAFEHEIKYNEAIDQLYQSDPDFIFIDENTIEEERILWVIRGIALYETAKKIYDVNSSYSARALMDDIDDFYQCYSDKKLTFSSFENYLLEREKYTYELSIQKIFKK